MSEGASLERFRGYLLVLAEGRMDERLRGRVDPAAVVDDVLADGEAPDLARLRGDLAAAMVEAAGGRGFGVGTPRARVRSLETAYRASSLRLEAAYPGIDPVNVGAAIAALGDGARRAVEMRVLQSLSTAEIGRQMGRSARSVAGVLGAAGRAVRAQLSDASIGGSGQFSRGRRRIGRSPSCP